MIAVAPKVIAKSLENDNVKINPTTKTPDNLVPGGGMVKARRIGHTFPFLRYPMDSLTVKMPEVDENGYATTIDCEGNTIKYKPWPLLYNSK